MLRPADSWGPISAAINAVLKADSGSSNPQAHERGVSRAGRGVHASAVLVGLAAAA